MTCITLDTIYQNVLDNIGFEQQGDVEMAKLFIEAANSYLFAAPMSQNDQGSSITISVTQIEKMVNRAYNFVAANSQSGRVSFLGVGNFFR